MKLICFDCDSTLSEIEGIDELAASKGPEIQQRIVDLTNQAMSGEVAIEEIFARRLELIQPSKALCEEVGALYIEKEAPGAKEVLGRLMEKGWKVVIISGGFIDPIIPFAKHLGVDEIYAVPLHFTQEGIYKGFTSSPTTRNGGKPEIVKELQSKYNPEVTVMVGDGVSDLECQEIVDMFIGYGEFVSRDKVKNEAKHFACSFTAIEELLKIYS